MIIIEISNQLSNFMNRAYSFSTHARGKNRVHINNTDGILTDNADNNYEYYIQIANGKWQMFHHK